MSKNLNDVEKLNTGYSLRASENLIRNLEKENFNLKLKIFLMEQKFGISTQYPNPKTDNDREIVEILEQNQFLRFQLCEKQSLLETALDAIEFLETSNEEYRKNFSNHQISTLKSTSINVRNYGFGIERKVSKQTKENHKKLKLIENLSSMLINNHSNSSKNTKEIENLHHQISSLQQKIKKLEDEKNHAEEIINEQNFLMKALNVRNISFGIIIFTILVKKLLQ